MGPGRWIAVGLVASVLVWVAISGGFTVPEIVAAFVAALPAVALAGFAARAMGVRFRPRRGWSRTLAGLPGAVVADTARLARHLPRLTRDGAVGSEQRGIARDLPPETRQADLTLLTLAATLTPTTVVLGDDPRAEVTLVHVLPPRRDADAAIQRWLP